MVGLVEATYIAVIFRTRNVTEIFLMTTCKTAVGGLGFRPPLGTDRRIRPGRALYGGIAVRRSAEERSGGGQSKGRPSERGAIVSSVAVGAVLQEWYVRLWACVNKVWLIMSTFPGSRSGVWRYRQVELVLDLSDHIPTSLYDINVGTRYNSPCVWAPLFHLTLG